MPSRSALDVDALVAPLNPLHGSRREHIRLFTGYYETGLINGSQGTGNAWHRSVNAGFPSTGIAERDPLTILAVCGHDIGLERFVTKLGKHPFSSVKRKGGLEGLKVMGAFKRSLHNRRAIGPEKIHDARHKPDCGRGQNRINQNKTRK